MTRQPPLVDIHCHLLPDLDDGPANWDDALAMARMAAADGIGMSVATPHQLGAHSRIQGTSIRATAAAMQQSLDRHGIALRVVPGAEVRIEPGLVAKLKHGEVLSLADHKRHVLLELPAEVYLPLGRLLAELGSASLVAVLAHPERNAGILARPEVLPPLVQAGCLVQVTAGSVLGAFGPEVQKFAQRLIQQGLVHFLATDAHGLQIRRPLLARAFDWVADAVGLDVAVRLCCRNPACVLAGRDVPALHDQTAKPRPRSWLWRRAG